MARKHKYYRRLWEKINNKTIPEGYHIHHLDNDKTNNDIRNLLCVSPEEHFEIHRDNYIKYGNPSLGKELLDLHYSLITKNKKSIS
jgi:hypothetical protein